MFELNIVTNFLAVFLLTIISYLFYSLTLRYWDFFSDRNVKFVRGWPVFGTHAKVFCPFVKQINLIDSFKKIYNDYPNNKIIGIYEMGGKPSYIIRDPNIVRDITIKDHDHFLNHFIQLDKSVDPLLGRSLFMMSNQPWRDMRSTLSPLFTGSKMRIMLTLMIECINDFSDSVEKEIGSSHGREYNMMDLLSQLTNDIISSTAFGLKMNSHENPNNEFYKYGKAVSYAVQNLKVFVVLSIPRLAKLLNIRIITEEQNNFFRDVVRKTVEERKRNNIVRNDMLHLLLLAQKGQLDEQRDKETDQDTGFATITEAMASKTTEKLKNWTEDDLVGQCVLFFIAGFTAVANSFAFLCHELAVNEDIQERLYQEVLSMNDELNGKQLTFESLQKMKYMDMVVSETLRLWPVGAAQDRAVSKQYMIEDYDGNKVLLQPNNIVWIPTFAIHRDPKYYPNPDSFNPERFSDENKRNIQSGTYLPFGLGPRACIASRFALLQMKASIYYILLRFKINATEKTPIPLKLKGGAVALQPENGFWNRLVPRK